MITNWDQLPLVMHPSHMAQLLGVEVRTIWKRLRAKRMRPLPDSWEKPYTWCRDRVRAELETGVKRVPVGRPTRRRPLQRAREAFAASSTTAQDSAQ